MPKCLRLNYSESRHASAGLKVLAINFRETDGTVKRFVEQTGLSLTVLRDRDGGVARDYGVKIYPTTIAVDRAGRARFSVTGEVDQARAGCGALVATIARIAGKVINVLPPQPCRITQFPSHCHLRRKR